VPTLNEYADEDGYYILARPSDTGNITYQLKPRGEQIVEKVGYQDGEEIGWQVISALKIPNLVYTGDEGAINNDTAVDLDKEEIDALNEEDAKQLLDELSSVPRVGDSQADKIQEILGVSGDSGYKLDMLGEHVETTLREQGIMNDRVPEIVSNDESFEEGSIIMGIDLREFENRQETDYEIWIYGKLGKLFEGEEFSISIGFRQNKGLISCTTVADGKLTTELVTNYQKLMADILSVVVTELESLGIEPGKPESLPAPKVTRMD